MKRVLVVGCSGAGKSVFARQLGEILNLPVIHLDRLQWLAGWIPRDKEEFRRLQLDAMEGSSWIVDGNYGATLDLRVPKEDTIFWLDYPGALCLYRAIKRYATYKHKVREDMGAGCSERLD